MGAVGSAHVPLVGCPRESQRTPDTPAVKEARTGPVESPEIALAAEAELENGRTLDKKRPPLVEECLAVAQVHHGGIDFNLAEIGVDGGVEGQIRAQADFRVGAEPRVERRSVVERIAESVRCKCGAGRRVGHDLEPPRRLDALDPYQIRKARHEAPAIPRRVRDVVELVFARDVAPEIDPPHVLAALDEPQLGVGDPQLGGPPPRIPRHLTLPDAVPRVVVPVVVEERAVIERAGRIDPEVEAAALVVIGIDVDLEAVGIGALIAPCQARDDRVGM